MELAIHYFSATGNTARAMGIIEDHFERAGNQVKTYCIGHEAPQLPRASDLNLFAFPILAWSAPTFVLKYLRRLPRVKGAKAAVFATFGGDPGFALQRAARILKSRGFEVFLTGGALYPDNWTQMMNPPEPEKANSMITEGDKATVRFANILAEGKSERFNVGWITGSVTSMLSISFRWIGRRFLGKVFVADLSCDGCGLCAKSCPVAVITLKGSETKRPYWSHTCTDCGRCINICPKGAIQTSMARLIIHGVFMAAAVTLGFKSFSWIQRFVAGTLTQPWRFIGSAAGAAGITLFGLWVAFVLLDRLIFQLESTSMGRRLFSLSHTKTFRRYRAPGFPG